MGPDSDREANKADSTSNVHVRVVEDRSAFEAANLPGRYPGSGPHFVDQTPVDAERFRGEEFCFLPNYLNHLGIHRRLLSRGVDITLPLFRETDPSRFSGEISRETKLCAPTIAQRQQKGTRESPSVPSDNGASAWESDR